MHLALGLLSLQKTDKYYLLFELLRLCCSVVTVQIKAVFILHFLFQESIVPFCLKSVLL